MRATAAKFLKITYSAPRAKTIALKQRSKQAPKVSENRFSNGHNTSGRKPARPDTFVLALRFDMSSLELWKTIQNKCLLLSSLPRLSNNASGMTRDMGVSIFLHLPPEHEELYVESVKERYMSVLPIPCEPFKPFVYTSGNAMRLVSKPSPGLWSLINGLIQDLEPHLDREYMHSLRNTNWNRQIRNPFLVYQKPEEVQMLVDSIIADYPDGIDLGEIVSIILRQGTAPHDVRQEIFFNRYEQHGRTVFKQGN